MGGSAAKSTCYSYSRPWFSSQHLHGCSQASLTGVLEDLAPSLASVGTRCVHIYMQTQHSDTPRAQVKATWIQSPMGKDYSDEARSWRVRETGTGRRQRSALRDTDQGQTLLRLIHPPLVSIHLTPHQHGEGARSNQPDYKTLKSAECNEDRLGRHGRAQKWKP